MKTVLLGLIALVVAAGYSGPRHIYLTLLSPVENLALTAADYIGFTTRAPDPTQNPKLVVTYTLGAPGTPVITSPTVANGTANSSFAYTITATGNPTSFATTTLPAGLNLDPSTGEISSTTTPTQVGSTTVTVSATNAAGTGTKVVTFNLDSSTQATTLPSLIITVFQRAPKASLDQSKVAVVLKFSFQGHAQMQLYSLSKKPACLRLS